MLVITKNKYEIEEPVKALGENEEILYEFTMQITPEEMGKIKKILLEEPFKIAQKDDKKEIYEDSLKLQEQFEEIIFKEHKETFKEKCGEYKYSEMVDLIYDFFMKAFIEKKTNHINTMNTNLKKITHN